MSILHRVFFALGAIVVFAILGGYLFPARWTVTRSIDVDASPEAVYALVSSFKTGWAQWNDQDFHGLGDPTIRYAYSGPEAGAGAEQAWTSQQVGNGHQKITKAMAGSAVEYELVLPDNGFRLDGRIVIEPIAGTQSQRVTWLVKGDAGNNPLRRYFGKVMNRVMGGAFERGLAKLKQLAEAAR